MSIKEEKDERRRRRKLEIKVSVRTFCLALITVTPVAGIRREDPISHEHHLPLWLRHDSFKGISLFWRAGLLFNPKVNRLSVYSYSQPSALRRSCIM